MTDFWLVMGTMILEGPTVSGGLFDTCVSSTPGFVPTANSGFYENAILDLNNPALKLPFYGRLQQGDPDPTGVFRKRISGYLRSKIGQAVAPVSYYTASKLCQLLYFDQILGYPFPFRRGIELANSVYQALPIHWQPMHLQLVGLCIIDSFTSSMIAGGDLTVPAEFNVDTTTTSFQNLVTGLSATNFLMAQAQIATSWGTGHCGETLVGYPGRPQIVP